MPNTVLASSENMTDPTFTIRDILTIDRTFLSTGVPSKKKAFELIAQTIAFSVPTLETNNIFDALIARERLGSTAIGHGVALPHCRLPVEQPLGCFILLKEGLDFDAPDQIPVNMLFALVTPIETNENHLALLAAIAELFHQTAFRQEIMSLNSRQKLYERLIDAPA